MLVNKDGNLYLVTAETHLDATGLELGADGMLVGVGVVVGAKVTVEYKTVGTQVLMVTTLMLPPAAGEPAPAPVPAPVPGEPALDVPLVLGTGAPDGDATVGS